MCPFDCDALCDFDVFCVFVDDAESELAVFFSLCVASPPRIGFLIVDAVGMAGFTWFANNDCVVCEMGSLIFIPASFELLAAFGITDLKDDDEVAAVGTPVLVGIAFFVGISLFLLSP